MGIDEDAFRFNGFGLDEGGLGCQVHVVLAQRDGPCLCLDFSSANFLGNPVRVSLSSNSACTMVSRGFSEGSWQLFGKNSTVLLILMLFVVGM